MDVNDPALRLLVDEGRHLLKLIARGCGEIEDRDVVAGDGAERSGFGKFRGEIENRRDTGANGLRCFAMIQKPAHPNLRRHLIPRVTFAAIVK